MRKLFLLGTVAVLAAGPALAQPQPSGGQPPARAAQQSPGPQSGSAASQNATRMSAMEFVRKAQMSDRFEIAASRLAQNQAQNDQVKRFAEEMVRDHTRTTQELMELAQQVQGGAQMSGTTQPGAASSRAGSGTTAPAGTAGGSTAGTSSGGTSSSTTAGTTQATGPTSGQMGGSSAGRSTQTTTGQSSGMTTAQGGVQAEGMDAEHQQMMQRLQSARGAEFDRTYMQQQVQAHQQAVDMFTSYSQQGDNAQLKQWAGKTLPTLQQHLQRAQQVQRTL